MGDTSEVDADGYRAWVKIQIEKEFPGAVVTVTDKQSTYCINSDAGDDDYDAIERLHAFVQHAWDSCNWDWIVVNV